MSNGKNEDRLFKVFCNECDERMQRALAILEQHGGANFNAESYDKLHQEFDSLVGAARAVNMPEMEQFNRVMAVFTRYLRNKLPLAASQEEKLLLRKAVELTTRCQNSTQHCILKHPQQVQSLLNAVQGILEKG
ncbi:MAG: hypothetical protein HKM22_05145 [Gammaproteobacteria bacterium]|nr:hypothetical protein [Gammaproteobacteria bacterium]